MIYSEWQTWFTNLDTAETQYEVHQDALSALEAKVLKDASTVEQITWESEIAAEKEYIATYETLKKQWTIGVGDLTQTVPGKWSLLLGLLKKTLDTSG